MLLEFLEYTLVGLEEAGEHGLKATGFHNRVGTVIGVQREVALEGFQVILTEVGLHEVQDKRPQVLGLHFHFIYLFAIYYSIVR